MWQYLALLISVVIGLLIIAIIWHIKNLVSVQEVYTVVPLKRYLYSKESSNLKAGDIIYTRSSIAALQELVIPYIYKHVAIIVEFKNNLYISETSGKGIIGRDKDKIIKRNGGVDLYPIRDRFKNTLGPIFLSKLNKPLSNIQNQKLQDTVVDHYGEQYPNLLKLYALFILSIPVDASFYCHTYVYACLINVGLIPNVKKSAHEIGTFITEISDYQLNDGFSYEKPKQLVFDNECEDELY